jgi:hypothetical protein
MRRYLAIFRLHRRISALLLCLTFIVGLTSIVLAQPINNFGNFVLNTRADLETLADEKVGVGQRPDGWTFNINNLNSPTYIADLWYDQELLAEQIYSTDRPANWIGASSTSDAQVVARNIRHDLEIAADTVYGKNNRPPAWRGGPALFRCDRTVMDTVFMLQTVYKVTFDLPESTVSYCQVIAGQAQDKVLEQALNTPDIEQTLPDLVLALRGDLERLADEQLGLNTRPQNWIGNKDKASPTLLSDTYLDLETLANDQLGSGSRPDGWQFNLPNAPVFAYRVLRYNLELLANALGRTPRPRGWQGTNPVETCDPQVQNLVTLAQQQYSFSTDSVPAGDNFCQQLAVATNAIVENPPQSQETVTEGNDQFVGESQIAFSYLDSAATQYMGMMPAGTKFKAWYRNFGNSTMMFVSGDNFAVFIDRRWTTLPQDVYSRLPTTEGVKPLTFCDASWCNGPGPTPTPTGFGAIQALLNANTPPAAPDIGQVQENKTQVSWNNIRVTYLLDNEAARTAQVTLEICTDTTQTNCEPVIQIFDNATGANKPVLSQSNGLNVYEFPYGYSSNLVIQSATLFSPDVWISDPTIR